MRHMFISCLDVNDLRILSWSGSVNAILGAIIGANENE